MLHHACGAGLVLLSLSAFPQSPSPAAQPAPPIGQVFVGDVRGQKSLEKVGTGMDVVSGSQLSAAAFPASLRLARGGTVVICPQSGLSVNTSPRGFMFGMGTGALEIEYTLKDDTADTLITPDFNIQLTGPGTYHFALGVNKEGDTCIRPLEGNKTGVVLSELLGTSVYKTGPSLEVLFAGGKLNAKPLTVSCGCTKPPAVTPAPPVAQAAPEPTPPPADNNSQSEHVLVANNDPSTSMPTDRPGQVHVEVDTPFVFNARNVRPVPIAKMKVATLPNVFFVQEKVDPIVLTASSEPVSAPQDPAQTAQVQPAKKEKDKEKKGFMGRLKGFFGGIFHR